MKNVFLLAGVSLALAACGSSGGSSSSNTPSTTSTNSNSSTQTNTSNTSNTNTQVQAGAKFLAKNNAGQRMNIAFNNANDIHEIVVNGTKVNLLGDYGSAINSGKIRTYGYGIGGNGSAKLNGIDGIYVSTASPNVVYGVLRNASGSAAFFNGKETAASQVPSSGKVDYSGNFFSTTGGSNVRMGVANLSADFGSKKLTGSASDLQLNANINGNKFESAAGAATTVKGGFFGVNAAEIGGMFQNGDTVGAFGATKK